MKSTMKSVVASALAFVVGSILASEVAAADSPTTKPHVIVLLADDLGYGDADCYEAKPTSGTSTRTSW
jgi:hypothetical protein